MFSGRKNTIPLKTQNVKQTLKLMRHLMIIIFLFFYTRPSVAQLPIPTPEKIQSTQRTFHLKDKYPTVYVVDKSASYLELLQKEVLHTTSIRLSNQKTESDN